MSSKWNPEKYHDDYREALMEVIEEKVEAGGKEIEEKPKKAPKPTKVIDLVSVLQKSLEDTGARSQVSRAKSASCEKSGVAVANGVWPVLFTCSASLDGPGLWLQAPAGLTRPLNIGQPDEP
jgi:hypothetical protein